MTLKSILCLSGVLAGACAVADTITWNATGTGDWSEKTNWSPQQVPTTTDEVVFPDLGADYTITVNSDYTVKHLEFSPFSTLHTMTLSGSGSLTATTASTNSEGKIKSKHKLILDGASVYMPKDYIMLYAPLEVRNGATFSIGSMLYVNHSSSCPLTVSGGHVVCTSLIHNNESLYGYIHLDGGSITATSFGNYKTGTRPFEIKITDGVFEIGQLNVTKSHETLRQTGGTIRITKGYNLTGGTIDLTGGTIELVGEFNEIDTLAAIRGFVKGSTVDTSKSVLAATNGVTHAFAGALTVGSLKNSGKVSGAFEIDELTFAGGATAPFSYTDKNYGGFSLYGPTTLRALADMTPAASDSVIYLHGDFTVDTTGSRTFVLNGAVSHEGSASMLATGGGTLKLVTRGRTESYASVQVAAGTTLDLIPPTNGGTVTGHLKTEAFTLGANATLKLVAGDNFIEASDWSIDPTAKIVVTVPSTFTEGACAVLQDMNSLALPAAFVDQIEVVGSPDGMTLKNDHGQITLFKRPNDLGKYGIWEWTGAGANAKWSTPANWYGNSNMPEKVTAYFGSSSKTNSIFDGKLWNGSEYAGTTVYALVFQTNAVDTFTISGTQMTLSGREVSSYSSVPQVVAFQQRTTDKTLTFSALGDAPLILACGTPAFRSTPSLMVFYGDIRIQQSLSVSRLNYGSVSGRSGGTWLSVLGGATCKFTNQDDLYGDSSGIRVAEGGTLIFSNDTANRRLTINRAEHSFVVNGLLDVQIPFCGRIADKGGRHVFRGKGRLNLNSINPLTYSMRAIFADTLNVYLTNDWTTASSAASGFALTARGNPLLHVGDGWTYGPSGDTSVAMSQRQLEIEKAGVLRVDAAGGAVTFADPFVGPGTLAITNATLALAGAFETDAKVRVDAEATLTIAANQTVGGLSGRGGTLAVAKGVVLAVNGDVDFSQIELPEIGFSWRPLVTASGSVTGVENRKYLQFRTVTKDGVTTLYARQKGGALLIVR